MLTATDEIANLIYRYDEHVDRGRFADAAALFADAAMVYERDGTASGAEEHEAVLRDTCRIHTDGRPHTLHLRTNLTIDIDDHEQMASAFSFFTVLQQTWTFPLQVILAGATRDRFERANGGWRFTNRSVEIRLTGDLTARTPVQRATP